MTSFQLQKLQPNNFDFCWSILSSWPDTERQHKGFGQTQQTLQSFVQQYGGYLVDGVGFCVTQEVSDIAEILLIAVHHRLLGQGYGQQMLTVVIDDLQKRDFAEVWLEAHAGNARALALYRKMGFVLTSVRAKYYSDGADALNLKLAFKTSAC